jgi:hypothetical protein
MTGESNLPDKSPELNVGDIIEIGTLIEGAESPEWCNPPWLMKVVQVLSDGTPLVHFKHGKVNKIPMARRFPK